MHLLLVEDNPADAFLVQTGLELIQSRHTLHVVGDGEEALSFLRKQGPFSTAPNPKLIIVDLNMPKMDGREFLAAFRRDLALRPTPVLVLSTTKNPTDISLCYRLGANSFVTKPNDIEDFFHLIQIIDTFWFRFSTFPVD